MKKAIIEPLVEMATTSWDGATLQSYPSGRPTFTMQRLTIPPHTKMDPHSHTIMQIGYILSGELTITSEDGESVTFGEGEPAIEVVGKVHGNVVKNSWQNCCNTLIYKKIDYLN
ncbi:MAG: cupin domain-containing protein [Rikenellaceae bacterium]